MKRLLNIAHRGASGHAPENTMAAFRLAKVLGADMIELDLWESADGQLVVLHDASLLRTTGVRGRISRFRLSEIRRLDAGAWFHPHFRGERIPTLKEVAAIRDIEINIELKGADPQKVLSELLHLGEAPRILLSSFDHRLLEQLREIDSSIRLGFLVHRESEQNIWKEAERLRPFSLHLPQQRVRTTFLERARSEGMRVFAYTVNLENTMRRLINAGVDGIFTNYPDRLNSLILREQH